MGLINSSCSHESVHVKYADPKTYTDKTNTFTFQIGNLKCLNCNLDLNGIKKKCIDHQHQHPWEVVNPHNCKHDIIIINNITNDKNMYYGRAECIICKTSIPVEKSIKYSVNDSSNWSVNNDKWLNENKQLLVKKIN